MSGTTAHGISAGRSPAKRWGGRLVLLALGLVGAGWVMLSTSRYGAGLNPDSASYVSAARSLAAGKGFVAYGGGPFVFWPPLYPVILASITLITRLDPLSFAHIVNAVLFGAVVYLSGLLFAHYMTRTSALLYLGTAAVLSARPLLSISVMALSDLPFTCSVLVFLVSACSYTTRPAGSSLIGMTLAAAAAALLRWPGVVLIPVGVMSILLHTNTAVRAKLLRALGLSVAAALPLAAWLALVMGSRRYISGRLPLGPGSSMVSWVLDTLESLHLEAATVLSWYARHSLHGLAGIRTLSSAMLAAALAVATLVYLSRSGVAALWSRVKAVLRRADPLLLFVLFYALFILFLHSHTTTAKGGPEIEDRIMSPVYVPITVLLFAFLCRSIGLLRTIPLLRNARPVLLSVACIWLLGAVADAGRNALELRRLGAGGYNTVSWRESSTMDFIEHLLRGPGAGAGSRVVYSNAPDALYLLKNINTRWSPFKRSAAVDDLGRSWPEQDGGLLAWFDSSWHRSALFTPSELQSIAHLDTLAVLSDGVVYRVSAKK